MTDWLPGDRCLPVADQLSLRRDEPDGSGMAGGVKMCMTTRAAGAGGPRIVRASYRSLDAGAGRQYSATCSRRWNWGNEDIEQTNEWTDAAPENRSHVG